MKLLSLLAVATALLGLALASQTPEEVEAVLQAYVQSRVAAVVGRPSLGRAGGGLACYDKYVPLITAATTNSKTETETCVNLAATRRVDELNKVKTQRETLDNQLKTVEDTLSGCSGQEEVLDFLTCLKDGSSLLKSTIDQLTATSTSLADGLSGAYSTIDNSENLCIQTVINKVKSDTDTLTAALQSCLMNGFEEPQPEEPQPEEPSGEPAEQPSGEPAEQPSGEPAAEPSGDDSQSEPGAEPGAEPAEEPAEQPAEEPAAEGDSADALIPSVDQFPEEQL